MLSVPAQIAQAAAPLPFVTTYDASYGDFKAEASRSLVLDEDTRHFTLESEIRLVILGNVLTSIKESSEFLWQDEQPLPQLYQYVQTGFGERSRTVHFDHAAAKAEFDMDGKTGTLSMTGPVFDDLSSYLLLKEKLAEGATDIQFDVVDRGEIKTYHYQVLEEEILATSLGNFATVRLERIRGGESTRRTEIWLVPEYDYLMVKLTQEEPNGRTIHLDLKSATLNGQAISAE